MVNLADLSGLPSLFRPSKVLESSRWDLMSALSGVIASYPEVDRRDARELCKLASAMPTDLYTLTNALRATEGIPETRAVEIAHSLSRKAIAIQTRERQMSSRIVYAVWMHSGASCMRDLTHPSFKEKHQNAAQDAAHRAMNGKRYEVANGAYVQGVWILPGMAEGCKCSSRSVVKI